MTDPSAVDQQSPAIPSRWYVGALAFVTADLTDIAAPVLTSPANVQRVTQAGTPVVGEWYVALQAPINILKADVHVRAYGASVAGWLTPQVTVFQGTADAAQQLKITFPKTTIASPAVTALANPGGFTLSIVQPAP